MPNINASELEDVLFHELQEPLKELSLTREELGGLAGDVASEVIRLVGNYGIHFTTVYDGDEEDN